MRRTAIVRDIALLLAVTFLTAEDGWPDELHFQLMVILFISAPAISIVALLRSGSQKSESWFSLLLERKRLEECAKIASLRKPGNET